MEEEEEEEEEEEGKIESTLLTQQFTNAHTHFLQFTVR